MDKKLKEEKLRQEKDAETIIRQIKKESEREVERITADARTTAEQLLLDAGEEAQRRRAEVLSGLKQETEKMRERIFSGLALEKKRLLLEEKERFINQVLDAVRLLAREFRENRQGYEDFLRKAIAEGVGVVGGKEFAVFFARPDAAIFDSPEFLKSLDKKISFAFTRGDFDEIGVIVSSPGDAIRFDNRFSSRLSRLQTDIYAQLLKESF
jgi:vacuolar-type H+-ATPase subunit E/Vma4